MADAEGNPFRFDDPVYVVCEGPADVRLVRQLIRRENLDGFSVNFSQGYERFARHIRGLTTSSDWHKLKRLLIIGDNDTQPAARWQNARRALMGEGLPAPDNPADIVDGEHERPSTGIFMMPSAHAFGALETLLVEAILQAHEGLAECLQRLDGCPATDCDGWDTVKRAKMQFRQRLQSHAGTTRALEPHTSGRRPTIRFRLPVRYSMSWLSSCDEPRNSEASSASGNANRITFTLSSTETTEPLEQSATTYCARVSVARYAARP